MMHENLRSVFLVLVAICMVTACDQDDEHGNNYSCDFIQVDAQMDGLIDETERSIMEDCSKDALSTKEEIENHLLGEWKLIGHGEGWVPTISQPCSYITIDRASLTMEFTNAITDTTTFHEWYIQEFASSLGTTFRLNVEPFFVEGVSINQFCEDYMFGDFTPLDGNMYLYRKVK